MVPRTERFAFYGGMPFTIIEQARSGNWVAATATGMAAARGEYLCWLHQDDAWQPRRLAALRRLIAAHPRAGLLVHPSWYMDVAGRRIGYWHCALPQADRPLTFAEVGPRLVVQCSIASCATVFSAEAVRRVGLPDPALSYHADWEYWLRLSLRTDTVYHRTPLASFRLHRGSQTIARVDEADDRLAQSLRIQTRYLRELQGLVDDPHQLTRVARFSSNANHALNRLAAGRLCNWQSLVRDAARLGPGGAWCFLRDSRIVERCLSRLQAGLGPRPPELERLWSMIGARSAPMARHCATSNASSETADGAMPHAIECQAGKPDRQHCQAGKPDLQMSGWNA